MLILGSFALIAALALSLYGFVAGIAGVAWRGEGPKRITETARRAGIAVWAFVTLAAICLVTQAFTNDFTNSYVLHHSNRDLPLAYKFAVLWSGQEGSLLFWVLLLSTYGLVLRLQHRTDPRLFAFAGIIIAGVESFFLMLVNFSAHPFGQVIGTIPQDGNGLNPLLQYPEMVIHPPMLYMGYVGFTVPFAFALAALIMRYPGEKWISITRKWTLVTWGFLTVGIFLGSHWAYNVLGWGGYWGWDPVENASFLPWLTGTAFLHSVMMQEKRGMLKTWNMWLIFSTFLLSIFGTFLTRSGVISSVHAFAQSSIGDWFAIFIALVLAVCVFYYVKNRHDLKSEHQLQSLMSRESSFLFNNLLFVIACFTVLWGTMFPILSEWVQGTKVTVGPPFFNRVMIPIGLVLLVLTAAGPLLAWGRTSVESIKRNFLWPTLASLVLGGVLVIFGVHPWESLSDFYALVTIVLSALVAFTIFAEFYRGGRVISRHTGAGLLPAMVQLTRRNTRRYGGYIVHFGIVLVMIGFAGTAFNKEVEQEMGFGDTMTVGAYTLTAKSFTQDDNSNFASEWAIVDVTKGGKLVTTLYPERRVYKASQQPATIVANRSTLAEDLYLVYEGRNPQSDKPILKVHLNPLVNWIWIGALILLAGTVLTLVPNMQSVKLAAAAPAAVPAGAGD